MNTTIDPKIQEVDRRVERAKESLMSRVGELGRRFKDVKNKVDFEAKIAAHPLPAVGIAFAVGALFALTGGGRRRREPGESAKRTFSGAIMAGLGAVAMRLVKNAVLEQLSGAARSWIDGRAEEVSTSERSASRDRSVEPFLEH